MAQYRRGSIRGFFRDKACLVGYWPLNGTPRDESGLNRHGTVSSVVPGPSKFGHMGYHFTGSTSEKIVIADTDDFDLNYDRWTIIVWVTFDSLTGEQGLITKGMGNGTWGLSKYPTTNVFSFWNDNGAAGPELHSAQRAMIKKRYCLIVTSQPNKILKMYINGKYEGNVTLTNYLTASVNDIWIGLRNNAGGDAPLRGTIWEAGILKRTVSQNEATAYYNWAIGGRRSPAMLEALLTLVRAMSDAVMNGASRSTTLGFTMGLIASIADSIMNAVSRLATLAHTVINDSRYTSRGTTYQNRQSSPGSGYTNRNSSPGSAYNDRYT